MKKKINYSSAPFEIKNALLGSKEISDFLPPPELLIPKEKTKKVTILLSQKSIEFFKNVSQKNHVPYQQMIRKVLDNYTDHYGNKT